MNEAYKIGYVLSQYRSVNECYNKPSKYKQMAENIIIEEMEVNGGRDYKIISHNKHFFTAGYRIGDLLVVRTPTKTIKIEL